MQNTRKWLIITVAIAFSLTLIASCVMLFSVKKVSVAFSVYGGAETLEIQDSVNALKGKSLIFLKESEVYEIAENYPRYEVVSVEKDYPNVLKISIRKRTEIFKIGNYVIDGEGIVLNDLGVTEYPETVLSVELSDINIIDAVVGKKIQTDDDGLFYSVISTAQSLNLNDNVKSVTVKKGEIGRDAEFMTNTGVKIEIWDVEDSGEEKIEKAFQFYEKLGDYQKSSGVIKSLRSESGGDIEPLWTSH